MKMKMFYAVNVQYILVCIILNIYLIISLIHNSQCFPNIGVVKPHTRDFLESMHDERTMQAIIMERFLNRSVSPCEDFYKFACGNWENINSIPKGNYEYDTLSILDEIALESVKLTLSEPILQQSTTGNSADINAEDKAKLFYSSCLDVDTINQRGSEPLLNLINSLGGWPVLDDNWNEEAFDFIELCANLTKLGHRHFLNMAIHADVIGNKENILYLEPVDFSLTDPTIYIDERRSKQLLGYKNFIIEVLELLGVKHEKAEETANEIITFEIKLVHVIAVFEENTEVNADFVPTTVGKLTKDYPEINMTRLLNLVFEKEFEPDQYLIIYGSPNFAKRIQFLKNTNNRTLANYLIWRCVVKTLINLDHSFLAAIMKFSTVSQGPSEEPERWKSCLSETNAQLGMAVGAQYVRKYFNEESKEDVKKMTEEIKSIFTNTLKSLDWLDSETKLKAAEKADAIKVLAGYPDFILSQKELNKHYGTVNIQAGKHFENTLEVIKLETMKKLKSLGQEHDKSEWPIQPAAANAIYGKHINTIVIPAGILQPPIYHKNFPKMLNYGAIGVFIGHELTHGFDNQGRQYDYHGKINSWWTKNSIEQFNQKSKCFVDQYSKFLVHNHSISGDKSLGENIADNGGIRQAFKAYQHWLSKATAEEIKNEQMPGLEFTREQLFFLSFAQSFCGAVLPEAVPFVSATDNHSPAETRIKGSVSNFDEFSKAFNCPINTPMNPIEKCSLW